MFQVDTTEPDFWADPHAVVRAARAAGPVAVDAFGCPLFLTYGALDEVLKHPAFVNDYDVLLTRHGIDSGPLYQWWKRVMLNSNPPVHTRLRTLANRAFTPKAVESMRARMRSLATAWMAAEARGSFDFIDAVAEPLPLAIVCDLIGIPDHHVFAAWVAELGLVFSDAPTADELARAEAALGHLTDYVAELVERLRGAATDTLLARLVSAEEAGDRLSHDELVALIINLMIGALDTSRSALCIGVLLMTRHGLCHADPLLVDEMLRYEPPIGEMRRTAAADVVVSGLAVRAGTSVGLSVFGANRDPLAYEEPDVFVPTRSGRPSFAFGRGAHFCLGQALARIEIEEVLNAVFARWPPLRLTEAPRWTPFARVRRFDQLSVSVD